MTDNVFTDKERELPDDYPMYNGYIYMIDGEPLRVTEDISVGQLKKLCGVESVRNCDIKSRNLWDYTF